MDRAVEGEERRRRRGASLRHTLFVAFLLIALIPVGLLALWTQREAYQKELDEVSERHLLLARNLSYALNRYARDVEAVFELSIVAMQAGTNIEGGIRPLLVEMGFEHDCIIDSNGLPVSIILNIEERKGYYTPDEMGKLVELAKQAKGKVAFSGVIGNWAGVPKLVVVKQLADGHVALGALNTDYLVRLQKAIAFGERGHSAIVDQFGRVLAHPNENWRLEMKDISKISSVQRMMAGETGVETFYSPAMDADMIAGFTSVQRTGWGVMVPQPLAELSRHANEVQAVSVLIGLLGLLVALALAWVLARYLARPIEDVAAVARSVRGGDVSARVGALPEPSPREITALAEAFNMMLGELQKTNAELRKKAAEADEANEAKSRFLANMSHELRTPLTAVIGYSDIMVERILGDFGPDGHYDEYALSINEAGQHLLQIVEEILLLTRSEAGRLEVHPAPTDVGDCVDFTMSMVRSQAQEKRIRLEKDIAPDVPSLQTDEAKLRQVLINLVTNSVKFTDPGGEIRITARADQRWGAVITVADTGIGIAASDMATVLEPFGQVANAYDRSHGGIGLGLPLTKELVALLGGEFELTSEPGRGTEATIRMPFRSPASFAPPQESDGLAAE
ncbi:MAG: sensor histidine kinase [Minwuia sp.]|uniref:sensor histidine kinase n=1 Tax=Minwuia sp. TaxID=2493630 RepID=UPI003A83A23D